MLYYLVMVFSGFILIAIGVIGYLSNSVIEKHTTSKIETVRITDKNGNSKA